MAAVYRFWVSLIALAVVAQIGLSGVGAFHAAKKVEDDKSITKDAFESWFSPHSALGYLLVLAALLLLVLAAVGRRDRLKLSAVAFGLFIVQVLLARLGSGVPALGFLHPINALVILATVGRLAHGEWRGAAVPAPAP